MRKGIGVPHGVREHDLDVLLGDEGDRATFSKTNSQARRSRRLGRAVLGHALEPFSNCVTSGVSPDWRPTAPGDAPEKTPARPLVRIVDRQQVFGWPASARMMMSASEGRSTSSAPNPE
jgi:hypothetical protein